MHLRVHGRGRSVYTAPTWEVIFAEVPLSTVNGCWRQLTVYLGKSHISIQLFIQTTGSKAVFTLLIDYFLFFTFICSVSAHPICLCSRGKRTQQGVNTYEISRNVISIIVHPSYNSQTSDNDIALLRLSSAVTFNDYIRPVCLAAQSSVFSSGPSSWITGWGNIQSGGTNLY